MSSRFGVVFGFGALVACAQPVSGELAHEAVLQTATRGLELHETGAAGHAGMRGTNCPFETVGGSVTGDYDLPDDDEEVVDSGDYTLFGSDTVMLLQPDTVHLIQKMTYRYNSDELRVPGVVDGRIADDDVVVVTDGPGGCAVVWTGTGATTDVGCSDGFDVDPQTGIAYVGGKKVQVVEPGGDSGPADVGGDLLAWDTETQGLFVARTGQSTVTALEDDGRIRWQVDVDGPITALESGGLRAAAVVAFEARDGSGVLSWLDGWTGDALFDADTPGAAPQLSTSKDGRIVAVVLPDEAHFFSVK